MASSQLDADLIRAYRAAVYRIDEAFDLTIDDYSEALDAWQRRYDLESSALITACNPAGQRCSSAFNAKANRELENLIVKAGHPYCSTLARDPQNQWPPEAGFLIGGIACADAEALAQAFDQNAWVWSAADAVPRLRLLR